jgi:hypothetical protein
MHNSSRICDARVPAIRAARKPCTSATSLKAYDSLAVMETVWYQLQFESQPMLARLRSIRVDVQITLTGLTIAKKRLQLRPDSKHEFAKKAGDVGHDHAAPAYVFVNSLINDTHVHGRRRGHGIFTIATERPQRWLHDSLKPSWSAWLPTPASAN